MKLVKVTTIQGSEVFLNPEDVSSVRRLDKRDCIAIDLKGNASSTQYSYLIDGDLDKVLDAFGCEIVEVRRPTDDLPDAYYR